MLFPHGEHPENPAMLWHRVFAGNTSSVGRITHEGDPDADVGRIWRICKRIRGADKLKFKVAIATTILGHSSIWELT